MSVEHPLWHANPVPADESVAATYVGVRLRVPGGRVVVAEPDPEWPRRFEAERRRLLLVLGTRVVAIYHVGSTAVAGLPAKPVLDIDLLVADACEEASYLPALQAADYRLVVRGPGADHRLLKDPAGTVNLHVFSVESREWRRHLLFRDWLRLHPADRDAYGAHKRSLTGREFTYITEYNAAKHDFIADLLDRIFRADLAAHPSSTTDRSD